MLNPEQQLAPVRVEVRINQRDMLRAGLIEQTANVLKGSRFLDGILTRQKETLLLSGEDGLRLTSLEASINLWVGVLLSPYQHLSRVRHGQDAADALEDGVL